MKNRGRIYLNVPFQEKWYTKKLGAKWDPGMKKWWARSSTRDYRLLKYAPLPEVSKLLREKFGR